MSPLDRLAALSTQRTASTRRLHGATRTLLDQLDFVEVGTTVIALGLYTLERTSKRTNVGVVRGWTFSSDGRLCDIDQPVNEEGYLHGDFNSPWKGPTRDDLIAFARYAGTFVDALVAHAVADIAALAKAQASVDAAAGKLGNVGEVES
jgi:hypothetical protein